MWTRIQTLSTFLKTIRLPHQVQLTEDLHLTSMRTEEDNLPVARLVDSTSVHITSMGAQDHTPRHHIEDLLMNTEVLSFMRIDPTHLTNLEDRSGTA